MPVPAAELAVQTRLTAAYIDTRPESIVFTPVTYAKDSSGGKKKTPGQPGPPQRVRFIEEGISRRLSDLGSQYVASAELLALPDAAISVDDEFTFGGGVWRVDKIEFPNGWSVRATVLRYGR